MQTGEKTKDERNREREREGKKSIGGERRKEIERERKMSEEKKEIEHH